MPHENNIPAARKQHSCHTKTTFLPRKQHSCQHSCHKSNIMGALSLYLTLFLNNLKIYCPLGIKTRCPMIATGDIRATNYRKMCKTLRKLLWVLRQLYSPNQMFTNLLLLWSGVRAPFGRLGGGAFRKIFRILC